jgi:hypothetical protein
MGTVTVMLACIIEVGKGGTRASRSIAIAAASRLSAPQERTRVTALTVPSLKTVNRTARGAVRSKPPAPPS